MKNIDIAERLKELMDSSPMKRSEYARRMGIPKNTLFYRLSCDPKWVDMIFQICEIAGVKAYTLFMHKNDVANVSGVSPDFVDLYNNFSKLPDEKKAEALKALKKTLKDLSRE